MTFRLPTTNPMHPRRGSDERPAGPDEQPLALRHVWQAWWPLAMSWLLMAAEQPAVAAIIARLPDGNVQLAAYGVVFPLALLIEAPVIMLLSASTELSRDREAYRALRAFMHRLSLLLTIVHLVVTVTPLYDFVMVTALSAPSEVVEAARPGMLLLLPWTWAIGSRRTDQGALIRYGFSTAVGRGTALRLLVSAIVLGVGYVSGAYPGVVVGTAALSIGVIVEALYANWSVRRLVRDAMPEKPLQPVLRGRAFLAFFVPLALTPLVTLVVQPVGAAALGRMPLVLESLAVWAVVSALVFLLQSGGLAHSEVVVALSGRPGARAALWRFTWILALILTAVVLVLVATPLRELWFRGVAGLPPRLADMAIVALWGGLFVPAMRVLESWFQGRFVVTRRTRPITEAVVVFAVTYVGVLMVGTALQRWPGLYVAVAALALGRVMQTLWLVQRTRSARRSA